MEISRILRVLITIILVVTFIIVTVSAYRQNERINSMTTLSDASTSLVTNLSTQKLVWTDSAGQTHPYILENKLENLEFSSSMAGENFIFRAAITYLEDNSEHEVGPYGPDLPEDQMTCSISASVAFRKKGVNLPAKLRVITWYA